MQVRRCQYCKQRFNPSKYHPRQRICSQIDCQRRRRNEYHRNRIRDDSGYRADCHQCQRNWRQAHPNYMREYRKSHRQLRLLESAFQSGRVVNMPDLVDNNLALDLKNCRGQVWLLCSNQSVKNTLASAEVILIKAPSWCSARRRVRRTTFWQYRGTRCITERHLRRLGDHIRNASDLLV
jgi:hypothetical protein